MKFCEKCDNMYYIGLNASDTNKLTYYCRYCGNVDETIADSGECVLNTQFKKTENFHHIINEYTKLDPTLPRMHNIQCPNVECNSNSSSASASNASNASASNASKKTPSEVIYIRYDDDNMKYLYLCAVCDTKWTTSDSTKV
jgi:DNA-directed RNA polymerase subunit M/transcription elongation factor TFIIS